MDQPIPLPEAERQAAKSQSQKARGNLRPRDGTLHLTVSRLPIANQVFLGSWMVDICQEGCSQILAPQWRHRACLRWCFAAHSGNQKAGTGEVIKTHNTPGTVSSPSTWSPELLGPGKGTKRMPNRVCALVEYPRT